MLVPVVPTVTSALHSGDSEKNVQFSRIMVIHLPVILDIAGTIVNWAHRRGVFTNNMGCDIITRYRHKSGKSLERDWKNYYIWKMRMIR